MRALPELHWPTPAAWAQRALESPRELLSDHAACELGAAATAQSLIARHPARGRFVEALATLAAEELRHFRRVHHLLGKIGGSFRPRPNPYLRALLARVAGGEREGLVDRLLVSALVERRSLERFELLAGSADGPLGALYRHLAPSEAGHAALFVELARGVADAPLEARLERWSQREAELAQSLPFAPRIHSGPPEAP